LQVFKHIFKKIGKKSLRIGEKNVVVGEIHTEIVSRLSKMLYEINILKIWIFSG